MLPQTLRGTQAHNYMKLFTLNASTLTEDVKLSYTLIETSPSYETAMWTGACTLIEEDAMVLNDDLRFK